MDHERDGKRKLFGRESLLRFPAIKLFFSFWLSLEQVFSVEFKKESFERFIEF
jgi:hypothetical protein